MVFNIKLLKHRTDSLADKTDDFVRPPRSDEVRVDSFFLKPPPQSYSVSFHGGFSISTLNPRAVHRDTELAMMTERNLCDARS